MTLNPSDGSKSPPSGAELQITCHAEKAPCNCSLLHPLALKHHCLSYRGQVLSAGLQPVHFQHHFRQCTDRILHPISPDPKLVDYVLSEEQRINATFKNGLQLQKQWCFMTHFYDRRNSRTVKYRSIFWVPVRFHLFYTESSHYTASKSSRSSY